MTEQSNSFGADGDGEEGVYVCVCVFLSTLLQSQGLITGYLSVPDTLLTCSSSGVTPVLISVSPLYFSLLIASTHPLLPHPLSFFFLSHYR